MHIFMKALDYYRKQDVEFSEVKLPHGYDKEFFVDLFCKYYAITGEKDSLILGDPDFIDEILRKSECKEFLSLPSPKYYIITSVQVAEQMIMKYKEEFRNNMMSLSDMEELDWELYHHGYFTDLEDRLASFEYRKYKTLLYLFDKLPKTVIIHKLRKLLISEREEIIYTRLHDELKSYEGQQFMKFLKICNRLRDVVKSEDVYYTRYDEIFREIENRKIYIDDIVPEEKYQQFKNCILVQDMFRCPTIGLQGKEWHIQEKPHLFHIKNKEAMRNSKSMKDKWEVWVSDDCYHEGAGVFNIRYRDEWDYVKDKMREGMRMCIDGESLLLYFSFLDICSVLRKNVDLSNIWCHTPNKVFELIDRYSVDITDEVCEIEWKRMKEFGQKWWKNVCPEVGKDTKIHQILHKTRRRFNIYFSKKRRRKHDIKWNNRIRREQKKQYKYSMRHIGK